MWEKGVKIKYNGIYISQGMNKPRLFNFYPLRTFKTYIRTFVYILYQHIFYVSYGLNTLHMLLLVYPFRITSLPVLALFYS